jgi:hypothetical protein
LWKIYFCQKIDTDFVEQDTSLFYDFFFLNDSFCAKNMYCIGKRRKIKRMPHSISILQALGIESTILCNQWNQSFAANHNSELFVSRQSRASFCLLNRRQWSVVPVSSTTLACLQWLELYAIFPANQNNCKIVSFKNSQMFWLLGLRGIQYCQQFCYISLTSLRNQRRQENPPGCESYAEARSLDPHKEEVFRKQ